MMSEIPSLEGQQIGHWVLTKRLGKGGMAVVYLAHHSYIDERSAAVKILHGPIDGLKRERFLREAKAINALDHPNVVKLIDFGFDERFETYYMVQEYLHGYELKELMHHQGLPLPMEQVRAISGQVCEGLIAIHEAGLIHRDLKPTNLFLVPQDDGHLHVKILDFGIVLQDRAESIAASPGASDRLTGNFVLGTPKYISPEQIDPGLEESPRTDLHALGVILYELLTGQVPVPRGDMLSRALFLSRPERPLAGSFRQELAGTALEAVLHQLIQRDPQHRPSSARDLQQMLQEAFAAWAIGSTPGTETKELASLPEETLSETPTLLQPLPSVAALEGSSQQEEDPTEHSAPHPIGTQAPALPAPKPSSRKQALEWIIGGLLVAGVSALGMFLWQQRDGDQPMPQVQCLGAGLTAKTQARIQRLMGSFKGRLEELFYRPKKPLRAWNGSQMALALSQDHLKLPLARKFGVHLSKARLKSCFCYERLPGTKEPSHFVLAWATIALLKIDPRRFRGELLAHLRALQAAQSARGYWMVHPKAKQTQENASLYPTLLSIWALHLALERRALLALSQAQASRLRDGLKRAVGWLSQAKAPTRAFWKVYPYNAHNEISQGITAMALYVWGATGLRTRAFEQQARRWARSIKSVEIPQLKGRFSQDFHPNLRIQMPKGLSYDPTRYLRLPWQLAAAHVVYPHLNLQQRAAVLAWTEKTLTQLNAKDIEDWRLAMGFFGLSQLRCSP